MTVQITPFSFNAVARYGPGESVPILSSQTGARIDLNDATEAHTPPFAVNTIVTIYPTVNTYIRIGDTVIASAADTEFWPAGIKDTRFVSAGHRISAVAA